MRHTCINLRIRKYFVCCLSLYYVQCYVDGFILMVRHISIFVDNNIPQCFLDGATDPKPGVNCVKKENIESVLQLLKRLQPILTRKTVSKVCENSSEKPYLTDADIVEMFTSEKVVGRDENWNLLYLRLLRYISDTCVLINLYFASTDEPQGKGGSS